MGMIDEVKAFDELLEYTELSPQAIALWYAILNRFNRAGWRSPISIANSTLCTKTGLSVAGLKRVRNTLVQIGLISYKPSTSNKAPLYTFVSVVAQSEPHTEPVTVPNTVLHTEPVTVPNTVLHTEPVTVPNTVLHTEPYTEPITRLRLDKDLDKDKKESKPKKVRKSPSNDIPPTREQVHEYCRERNNNVDPDRFYDYYESNGWMVGKHKMKDWKAAVRTWERNGYNSSRPASKQPKETMAERAERLEKEMKADGFETDYDSTSGIPF